MSRALRRHPVGAQPGKRPAKPAPIRTGASRPQRQQESRGIRGVLWPRWLQEIISELRKVTWPTREETINLTWVVVLVAGTVGIFLASVDMFFNWVIEQTLLK